MVGKKKKKISNRMKDYTGLRSGYLEVLEFCSVKNKKTYWKVKCRKCNSINSSRIDTVKCNVSCGCKKLKHGQTRRSLPNKQTKTYTTWIALRDRCYNPNNGAYENYGGRGIRVCKRWLDSFENFYLDMGECPKNKSIDRINVNGNYSPKNCRWATAKQQSVNRRGKNKGTSKYKGVVRFSEKKWRARIRIDNKLICLGLYDKEKDAAKAYNGAAKEAWGEDAFINKI